jgi:threonine synthase
LWGLKRRPPTRLSCPQRRQNLGVGSVQAKRGVGRASVGLSVLPKTHNVHPVTTERAFQQCLNPSCAHTVGVTESKVACPKCGSLLEIRYNWDKLPVPKSLSYFEHRWATKGSEMDGRLDFSGVWRFRELFPFFRTESDIVTIGEGRTVLQQADILARNLGMNARNLYLQYEGLNPSGSFKDNGMTAAFTHARMVGAKKVACASTGNTSASLAMFASLAEIEGIVFIGSGKIAFGKLSQALDYGAKTLQIKGDFDACLHRIRQIATSVPELGIYLMNSVNPFRLEGQKSIMLRVLEALGWNVPDWIIVPGGNLGNCSAFGKAFMEMKMLGLIDRIPRLAVINAAGANTLHQLYHHRGLRWNEGRVDCEILGQFYGEMNEGNVKARTVASAIEIGRPVNLAKALRALDVMSGVTRQVTDDEILESRAMVARWGFGCEPASAASIAGLQQLLADGTIGKSERVVCILTGHELKDPNETVKYHTGIDMKAVQDTAPRSEPHGKLSNRPIAVADDLASIIEALGGDPRLADNVKIDPSVMRLGGEY